MAAKKKHHTTGQNIKTNAVKRLEKAKRLWKSENYIKDLEKRVAKMH